MSLNDKIATARKKIEDHPEAVVVGGIVLIVVGVKLGHAKPKPVVNKEFARRAAALVRHLEDGELRSGDSFFDAAYSQGVWDAAREFNKVLNSAKTVK